MAFISAYAVAGKNQAQDIFSTNVLGWLGPRPVHVVAADNTIDRENIVFTVYEPDPAEWETDFKRRRVS
jgi:hypothetical protein